MPPLPISHEFPQPVAKGSAAAKSAALPDDLREAIILCEREDHSLAEAATLLDTTVKAVESRLYRARHQLRRRLTRWLGAA